jgi:PAS domain S-box-containing protein
MPTSSVQTTPRSVPLKQPKKEEFPHLSPEEKEASLHAIIENFDGYVWSVDRNLQYIVLNTALQDKIRELIGVEARPGDKMLDLLTMLDPTKTKEWKKLCQQAFKGKKQRVVQEFCLNGLPAFYEFSINPIQKGKEVVGLSCFARDITAEVQTEQKLKTNQTRFRALIEKSTDIIVVVDGEGKINYASPSVKNLFGVDETESANKNSFDYIHPEDISRLAIELVELLDHPDQPRPIQARATTKEGKIIWVEGIVTNLLETEGINGIVCNFRDVTERVLAEEALRQRELMFRSLIENNTDLIMMANNKGEFTYGSPSVTRTLGYQGEEFLNTSVFTLVHPDSMPVAHRLLEDLMAHPGETFTIFLNLLHKNGHSIWVEGLATNLLHIPEVNALVANFRDIEERKKAEKQVRDKEDQNRQLEHLLTEEKVLRQKETMQAAIDAQEKEREEIGRELHDNVNQLLTTARLYLDHISDQHSSEQRHIIGRSSHIITTAIEEIRKLSGAMTQSFHKEIGLQLSLEDLVESIRKLTENVTATLDFSLPAEQFLNDKLKLTLFRIVQELLNNVLKHAGATQIDITVRQEADTLLLRVNDNGKGFDPRKKRNGIGISNIISRAEVFNGHLIIDSAPGKGCRMSIVFKLAGIPAA